MKSIVLNFPRSIVWLQLAAGVLMCTAGCATSNVAHRSPSHERFVQVEYGRENRFVDGVGWVVGIPRKVFLWDRRVDNHAVHPHTVQQVVDYLDDEGQQDVLVRVNQYDPAGEWRRLRSNREVGAGWRYTFGALSWLEYTVLPGRVFGQDRYNPYTNTVSLYSDAAPMGIVEAAYAADVDSRTYPGAYAAVNGIPLVGMWHETLATRRSLDYVAANQPANFEATSRLLYPRYGLAAGDGVASYVGGLWPVFQATGAVSGHIAHAATRRSSGGRTAADDRTENAVAAQPSDANDDAAIVQISAQSPDIVSAE